MVPPLFNSTSSKAVTPAHTPPIPLPSPSPALHHPSSFPPIIPSFVFISPSGPALFETVAPPTHRALTACEGIHPITINIPPRRQIALRHTRPLCNNLAEAAQIGLGRHFKGARRSVRTGLRALCGQAASAPAR